jgi:hypothetical protein
MTTHDMPGGATGHSDPRHTFLSTAEVFLRYGWGRSTGYVRIAAPGFPNKLGNRYRLDQLMAWEDTQAAISSAEAAPETETDETTTDTEDAAPPAPVRRRTRKSAEADTLIPPRRNSRRRGNAAGEAVA